MQVRRFLTAASALHCFIPRKRFVSAAAAMTTMMASSSSTHATPPNNNNSMNDADTTSFQATVEYRMRRALWCFFAGDALASPTHWFYGGYRQVQQTYGGGRNGIVDYTKPVLELPGSIMNKSNLNGGGRSSSSTSSSSWFGSKQRKENISIVGDVINHGKAKYWNPSKQIHYHATLEKGENTLEAQLARVLMKSIVQTNGVFDPNHFRQAYVQFMTTKGSHNDAYASTCHRMFFANMVFENKNPIDCPDDDGHNVNTVDGLVLPTIVSLAVAGRTAANAEANAASGLIEHDPSTYWRDEIVKQSMECVAVTRRSSHLQRAAGAWGQLIGSSVLLLGRTSSTSAVIQETAVSVANALGFRQPRAHTQGAVTACYIDSALPALLDDVVTFADTNNSNENEPETTRVWDALLQNANTGGENVHRGSCLGAVLGAISSPSTSPSSSNDPKYVGLPPQLIDGLYDHADLETEIDAFVDAVMMKTKDKACSSSSSSSGGGAKQES